jgi:diguanylate cyclase (GGDEF)-like protein/PAS domain S-box-containing protein
MNATPNPALDVLLLDQAAELLLILEPISLRIRAANRYARERLGHDDLLGMAITDIACALTDVFYWEAAQAGDIREIEAAEGLFQCADGSLFTVAQSVRVVVDGEQAWLALRARDLSRESERRELLARTASQLRATLEATADGILVRDQGGAIINMNRRFASIWRLPEDLLSHAVDAEVFAFMASRCADPAAFAARLDAIAGLLDEDTVDVLALIDGQVLEQTTRPHYLEERIIGRVYTYADITARTRDELELRIAAIAFESQEAIAITDADQTILRVNRAFSLITGYAIEEAIGRKPADLLKSGRHGDAYYRAMWDALNHEGHWQGEIWNRRKSGAIFPEWLTITAVKDERGHTVNYVAAFSDTSQSKQAEAEIHALAFYDPLTELPNRRLLQDRLSHTLTTSERSRNFGAILLLDLDHFKELNDTKGHGYGDLLLIEVARRLRGGLRADDTVARLGGDEFVVILADLGTANDPAAIQAETIAEKLRAEINRPFALNDDEYHSSPSIGICLFHGQDVSVADLLKRADTAMYQAKRSGRNAIRFFDPATHAAMTERIALDSALRRALPDGQLRLYYQMQVDQQRRIIGAEALLRWQHPERNLVSPLQFIPLAEETGQIVAIGRWVLETACAQLRAWQADPATRALTLAVNVSARQFRQIDFVDQVLAVLAGAGVDPGLLKLELTESLVLDNVADTIAKMQALKTAGVRFSLDDFGTGYSSLAYLTRLPLDQVKIDQSFVGNIGIQASDQVIVQTIIGMADNLGLGVIAEGVETQAQLDFLLRHGCPAFQGYLFGEPVPLADFERALSRQAC